MNEKHVPRTGTCFSHEELIGSWLPGKKTAPQQVQGRMRKKEAKDESLLPCNQKYCKMTKEISEGDDRIETAYHVLSR
jgi:hypothetical protein